MRLQILAVGKMKAGPEQDLYARYAGRIGKFGRSLRLEAPELIEIPESKHSHAPERKEDEARTLLSKATSGATIILLDEHGKECSSTEFARLIEVERDSGTSALAFALGGPDGHGDRLINAASKTIRFGKMTWPHQLARILLVEQLYRATTILSGHPYHRE